MDNRAGVSWPSERLTQIPYRLYMDADQYDLEQERIFKGPVWHHLCLGNEIPEEGSFAKVRSNFRVARIVKDGETMLFVTGEYRDNVDVTSEPFKFIERPVLTDSHKFDTLLALPL